MLAATAHWVSADEPARRRTSGDRAPKARGSRAGRSSVAPLPSAPQGRNRSSCDARVARPAPRSALFDDRPGCPDEPRACAFPLRRRPSWLGACGISWQTQVRWLMYVQWDNTSRIAADPLPIAQGERKVEVTISIGLAALG